MKKTGILILLIFILTISLITGCHLSFRENILSNENGINNGSRIYNVSNASGMIDIDRDDYFRWPYNAQYKIVKFSLNSIFECWYASDPDNEDGDGILEDDEGILEIGDGLILVEEESNTSGGMVFENDQTRWLALKLDPDILPRNSDKNTMETFIKFSCQEDGVVIRVTKYFYIC